MKAVGFVLMGLLSSQAAVADVIPFDYQLGATSVTEDAEQILIHASPPISIAILPGGRNWPVLSLGEDGRVYAGPKVLDGATGRLLMQSDATLLLPHGVEVTALADGYRLRRGGRDCQLSLPQLHLGPGKTALQNLQDYNLVLTASETGLLALVTQFGEDGQDDNYLLESIDTQTCKVTVGKSLGNPDLLVELGHSARGGWWLTGSIEQTLLRSSDGRDWHPVKLPEGLSSLISSYVVDNNEIWLAAILPDETPSPHLLVHSADGGRHWRNLVQDDPLLAKVPAAWLEGQRRRVVQP